MAQAGQQSKISTSGVAAKEALAAAQRSGVLHVRSAGASMERMAER